MSLKSSLKRAMTRAMRPGLLDTNARLDRVERLLADMAAGGGQDGVVWRGGLERGRAVGPNGAEHAAMTTKYRDELRFWVHAARNPDQVRGLEGGYEPTIGRWQRERLIELMEFLDLGGDAEIDAWAANVRVVEVGSGPYPAIATTRWKRAVAIDPLADGYVVEDLVPKLAHADGVTFIASTGEWTPLATGDADLVVMENCLDHVEEPAKVVAEARRLLRPGGMLWLLVDLMDYSDHLHPNSFNEQKLRALLDAGGFEVVRDRVSDDHKSHPNAYGEYRALLRSRDRRPAEATAHEASTAAAAAT